MRIVSSDGSILHRTSFFERFSKQAEYAMGHPQAFAVAVGAILLWAGTGPFFGYSDTWQLVINTATTIVTFLMVFLIQNSQNRDSAAIQLKLDELIRSREGAHNALLNWEGLTLDEIQEIKAHYEKLASCARNNVKQGTADTDTPEVQLG